MFTNINEMSLAAANHLYKQIDPARSFVLCPASGNTPKQTYELFVQKVKKRNIDLEQLGIIMLDEWLGLPTGHPASCQYQIREALIRPLGIKNHFIFNGNDVEQEIKRFSEANIGSIDMCILGLGTNGHIGLNEPGTSLQPYCHKVLLSEASQNHPMIEGIVPKPKFGVTLGMRDILSAKSIMLLVSGVAKKKAFLAMRTKKISTHLPASFLWLHPKVICYYTQDVTM